MSNTGRVDSRVEVVEVVGAFAELQPVTVVLSQQVLLSLFADLHGKHKGLKMHRGKTS